MAFYDYDDVELIQFAEDRRLQCLDEDTQLEYRREQGTLAYYANTGVYPDGSEVSQGLSSVQHNVMRPCTDTLTTYHVKASLDENPIQIASANATMEEQMKADQLSKLLNAVWKINNTGDFVESLVQSSLINVCGFAKATWDDTPTVSMVPVPNATLEQINAIMAEMEAVGDGVSVEVMEGESVMQSVTQMDMMTGEEVSIEVESGSDWMLRVIHPTGIPRVSILRPNNVEINSGTTSINQDPYTHSVFHSATLPGQTVIDMFPDVEIDMEKLEDGSANTDDSDETRGALTDRSQNSDTTTGDYESVVLREAWVKLDNVDYPGFSHLIYSGQQLIVAEDHVGPIPITQYSPFAIPHEFYGLGLWDKLRDKQTVLTAMRRNHVDYTVLTSTHAMSPIISSMAGESAVENFEQGRVGPKVIEDGVDKVSDAVMFPSVPTQVQGNEAIAQSVNQEVISEVGIDYIAGVVSADIEKSGNDQAKTAMVMDNASAKIEKMVRRFADGPMIDISLNWTDMLIRNADTFAVKRLVEMVTPGEPFYAASDYIYYPTARADYVIKAGLGHIKREVKIQQMMAIRALQKEAIADGGFVPPEKINMASEKIVELMDEDPGSYFATPEEIAQYKQEIQGAAQMEAMALQQQTAQTLQIAQESHTAQMAEQRAKTAKLIAEANNLSFEQALQMMEFEEKKINNALERQIASSQAGPVTVGISL